jgi:hypothetical protein
MCGVLKNKFSVHQLMSLSEQTELFQQTEQTYLHLYAYVCK